MDLISRLQGVKRTGDGWTARCPAHEDKHSSLSVAHRDGKWLLKCHAGCAWEAVVAALGIEASDLFDEERVLPLPNNTATLQRSPGLTLQQFAAEKQLPEEFLRACGLSDGKFNGRPAVQIPYLGVDGTVAALRWRIATVGDRFRWQSRSKPQLYGLNRLQEAREAGSVVLVEGECDCLTLWFHGIPAIGIPGATNWREDRDAAHLDGIDTIYVVIEPDAGGVAVRKWLAQSIIRHRVKLLTLPLKDPSAMHLADPDGFRRAWQVALLGALPWTAVEEEHQAEQRTEAWDQCADLARSPSILAELDKDLSRVGLVGERRVGKLVYLAVVSRLLDRPVSVAVKGPSSGGKSFVVESALKFFPPEAFYSLTAMSDKALAYSAEPLKHRHLVVYEAAGLKSDFASYLIRSLLSEGRLRYETVEKTKDGLSPRLIEREGPTGLIVTTTSVRLHPENETRMLSLTVTDTHDQTAAVFRALASEGANDQPDLSRWHALQVWMSTSQCKVSIPYADQLAALVPPVAIRMRRDFKTILNLVRAHAILHQALRQKDADGCIVADLSDYAAVRDLVADVVAEGIGATVRPAIREVVEAVATLIKARHDGGEDRRPGDGAETRQKRGFPPGFRRD